MKCLGVCARRCVQLPYGRSLGSSGLKRLMHFKLLFDTRLGFSNTTIYGA